MSRRLLLDKYGPRSFKGVIKGASFKRGHRLITGDFPTPSREYKRNISIVGSGVSGLSCAYHLAKHRVEDIELFELEDHIGGKSASLDSRAPWGAHYLPLVNKENSSLLNFLKDAGVVKRIDDKGVHYDPFALCSDPMEKLFIHGRLQEGIIPKNGISPEDQREFDQLFKELEKFRSKKGRDGKFAFDIPMEESSSDSEFLEFDKMTMAEYLDSLGIQSESVRWYVDYSCRDDYGMKFDEISAWAGLHYFCSRRGQGVGVHQESVMTWPEGNNFLITKLRERSLATLKSGSMLYKVEEKKLYFFDFHKEESYIVHSNQIILALPQFIIAKVLKIKSDFDYSPWMVANLEIDWDEKTARNLAWDNVNYHGKGVGFVSANHQNLKRYQSTNFLTYYWPLSHLPVKEARLFALKRTHEQWCKDIMGDMKPLIPDLEKRVKRIDIWPWGHAMVTAPPGFIHSKRKEAFTNQSEFLHFAHTDLGGLSLFEEGFYRGEVAASRVMASLAKKARS